MDNLFEIAVKSIVPTETLGTSYGFCTIPKNFFDENSICYCVGAGEDISFDCELATKYRPDVFIFDPTPRAKVHFEELLRKVSKDEQMPINNSTELFYEIDKKTLSNMKFYEYGIWSETKEVQFFAPKKDEYVSHSAVNLQNRHSTFKAQCYSVKDLMEKLGHSKLDLLKLDVEGAEFEIIDNLLHDDLDIKVLYIEFHEVDNFIHKTRECISKLETIGYKVVDIKKRDILFVKGDCID